MNRPKKTDKRNRDGTKGQESPHEKNSSTARGSRHRPTPIALRSVRVPNNYGMFFPAGPVHSLRLPVSCSHSLPQQIHFPQPTANLVPTSRNQPLIWFQLGTVRDTTVYFRLDVVTTAARCSTPPPRPRFPTPVPASSPPRAPRGDAPARVGSAGARPTRSSPSDRHRDRRSPSRSATRRWRARPGSLRKESRLERVISLLVHARRDYLGLIERDQPDLRRERRASHCSRTPRTRARFSISATFTDSPEVAKMPSMSRRCFSDPPSR